VLYSRQRFKLKTILIKIYEQNKRRFRLLRRLIKAPRLPVNPGGKIYLNLGCGSASDREFINIDVVGLPNIHHLHDIKDLSMFSSNSVDLIYASHVVEHLPRELLIKTLTEWNRVLKKNGILRFSVPDFDQLIKIYRGNGNDVLVIQDQVLGQKPPYDNHYTLWNFKFAERVLKESGFWPIRSWSPEKVNHHNFVDRSSRAITVDDTTVFLSLNLEALKP